MRHGLQGHTTSLAAFRYVRVVSHAPSDKRCQCQLIMAQPSPLCWQCPQLCGPHPQPHSGCSALGLLPHPMCAVSWVHSRLLVTNWKMKCKPCSGPQLVVWIEMQVDHSVGPVGVSAMAHPPSFLLNPYITNHTCNPFQMTVCHFGPPPPSLHSTPIWQSMCTMVACHGYSHTKACWTTPIPVQGGLPSNMSAQPWPGGSQLAALTNGATCTGIGSLEGRPGTMPPKALGKRWEVPQVPSLHTSCRKWTSRPHGP